MSSTVSLERGLGAREQGDAMNEVEDSVPLVATGDVDHTHDNLTDPRYAMSACGSIALRAALCLSAACIYLSTSLLVAFFPRAAMARQLSQIDVGAAPFS